VSRMSYMPSAQLNLLPCANLVTPHLWISNVSGATR